ncbi:MAG: hypothetical protein IJW73_08315, partial [Candidatus Gastranaerophilales bacterium]|nr:hypothetical protein [Candidatus Gastranaerophilales bacterium]
MSNAQSTLNSYDDKNKMTYATLLSSLFSSFAIIILSFLCILNNIPLDLYGTFLLLKTTFSAAISLWFVGFIIGKIFDSTLIKQEQQKIKEEKEVYDMPSMFSANYSSDPQGMFDMEAASSETLSMDD